MGKDTSLELTEKSVINSEVLRANGVFAGVRLWAVMLLGSQAAVMIINYIVTSLGEPVLYVTAAAAVARSGVQKLKIKQMHWLI